MRLHLLKLRNKSLYSAAKLARAMLSELEYFLRPGDGTERRIPYDLRERVFRAQSRPGDGIPPRLRAARQMENIAAYLEKIRSDTHLHLTERLNCVASLHPARHDEYIIYSFLLLHKALELIYKDLTALRKRPISGDIKAIAALARKNLRLAGRRAAADEDGFIENLKFDRIYGSLDRCFDCVEIYVDELR